jgi:hypothetical protein
MRFRERIDALLALPWHLPLADWDDGSIELVDLPIGASRHTVRFVLIDDRIVALKELPIHPARREYEVMRELEARGAPAVKAIGLVERPAEDAAVIATRYLERSFQFRRLFMRLPDGARHHRDRLLDAMTNLLVELHRTGVFWGDCSLANTLLLRDGQTVQAYLVDAETSEVHDRLSDGQREMDLELAIENVAGDLADLAAMSGRGIDELDDDFAAALGLRDRYERLWDELHDDIPIEGDQRYRVDARLRALNDMGYVIDEVILEPSGESSEALRLRVAVASRRYHALRLRQLTGIEAGEGQAAILLNDMTAWVSLRRCGSLGKDGHKLAKHDGKDGLVRRADATEWLIEVYEPSVAELRGALGPDIDPVQSYCDLLEVRWLLSEQAGRDVGNTVTVQQMADLAVPAGSVAGMVVAEESPRTRRLGWNRP